MAKELDSQTKERISYINSMIIGFARGFKRSVKEAYLYLEEFGGLSFLRRHYKTEMLESEVNTHITLLNVCRRNGGWL